MTERNLLIGFIVVLVVVAGAVGLFSKFKTDFMTPIPTPDQDLNFVQSTPLPTQPGQSVQSKKVMKTYPKFPGNLPLKDLQNSAGFPSKKAVIQTNKGKIEFEVYPEATKAASNFIFLAKDGFYDGLTIHRVVPGFVIQGGDPLGNGTGGPGYKFEDEPVNRNYDKGIVAMANAGPNTNGSQFFIMLEDNQTLPKNYTIFGKVITGQEIVDKIAVGDIMQKVTIEAK